MKIYEWFVNEMDMYYAIQVIENNVEAARKKAIKHLEQDTISKRLLNRVKTKNPVEYEKGVQTIIEVPYEGSDIRTY